MGRRVDDRIFRALELRHDARIASDTDLGHWTWHRDRPGRYPPPAPSPSRSFGRSHAGLQPRLAARTGERRMEHRHGKRHRAFRLVKLRQDNFRETAGLLYDISRQGMFVVTRRPEIGAGSCLELDLPSTGGRTVRISALVVHRSEYGLGLIFRHLDPAAAAAVEELCRHR